MVVVGALERKEQTFFFVLWFTAQQFLVAADERYRQRAASRLSGPLRAQVGVLAMNDERPAPRFAARFTLAQPGQQSGGKASAQHNDRAMRRGDPRRRFAHIVQKRRSEQVLFGMPLMAQRAHDPQAVGLIGDAHPAKERLRAWWQEFIHLAQVVGCDARQQRADKLAHAVSSRHSNS